MIFRIVSISISFRPSHLRLSPFLAFLVNDTLLASSREDPSRVCPKTKTFLRTKSDNGSFPLPHEFATGCLNFRPNEMSPTAPLQTSIFRFRFRLCFFQSALFPAVSDGHLHSLRLGMAVANLASGYPISRLMHQFAR